MNSVYMRAILAAVMLFVPVAGVFTLPFMVTEYRKYGRIPVLRVLVVYSFILYMMCAFLLTVLPLPDFATVEQLTTPFLQVIPFSTWYRAFEVSGFEVKAPATFLSAENWGTLFSSSNLFEILANILMQIPLGIYLRYYFRCSKKKTVLIGLLVSLFYELTQLSGLYFIYPRPYRLCSVDDLIDNTLGALIGYGITPLVCAVLPTREELDDLALGKQRRITAMRRGTAAVVDWVIWFFIWAPLEARLGNTFARFTVVFLICYLVYVLFMFVVVQKLTGGYTPGKYLIRIRVSALEGEGVPSWKQLFKRYSLIYIALPVFLLGFFFGALIFSSAAIYARSDTMRFVSLLLLFFLLGLFGVCVFRILHRHRVLPHTFLSGTHISLCPTSREGMPERLKNTLKHAALRNAKLNEHKTGRKRHRRK